MAKRIIYKLGEEIVWRDEPDENFTHTSIVLGYGKDTRGDKDSYYLVEVPKKMEDDYGWNFDDTGYQDDEDMKWAYIAPKHFLQGTRLYFVNEEKVEKGELEIQIDLIKKEIYGKKRSYTKKKS